MSVEVRKYFPCFIFTPSKTKILGASSPSEGPLAEKKCAIPYIDISFFGASVSPISHKWEPWRRIITDTSTTHHWRQPKKCCLDKILWSNHKTAMFMKAKAFKTDINDRFRSWNNEETGRNSPNLWTPCFFEMRNSDSPNCPSHIFFPKVCTFLAAREEVWKSLVSIEAGGQKTLEQFTSGSQIVESSLVLNTWV